MFASQRAHLLARENELDQVKNAALEFVTRRDSGLSSGRVRSVAHRHSSRQNSEQKIPQQLEEYVRGSRRPPRQTRVATGHISSKKELTRARLALLQTSQRILPHYLRLRLGRCSSPNRSLRRASFRPRNSREPRTGTSPSPLSPAYRREERYLWRIRPFRLGFGALRRTGSS